MHQCLLSAQVCCPVHREPQNLFVYLLCSLGLGRGILGVAQEYVKCYAADGKDLETYVRVVVGSVSATQVYVFGFDTGMWIGVRPNRLGRPNEGSAPRRRFRTSCLKVGLTLTTNWRVTEARVVAVGAFKKLAASCQSTELPI